ETRLESAKQFDRMNKPVSPKCPFCPRDFFEMHKDRYLYLPSPNEFTFASVSSHVENAMRLSS
ncbi:unnamed protein product, partial [Thlaspi arvense]